MWNKLKNYFSKDNIQKSTCQICLEPLTPQNAVQLCDCQHINCRQCVTMYLKTKIVAFETIKCLDQKCTSQINEKTQFYASLPTQTKLKYEKIKRFYFVSKNPQFKLCPKETCTGLVNTKKKPCLCNVCSQKYCPKCLLKDHWGKCQQQSVLFLQNKLKYIQCSHCNFIIQKNEGCDHITCKCGYQLCYKCGGVWKGAEHMCVRSKGFQWARSWILSLKERGRFVREVAVVQKFFSMIGKVLLNIFYVNGVLAIILTLVEIIYSVISWISPFGFISSIFSSEQQVETVAETSVEEEGGFPYLWVYLALVFVLWCIIKKWVPKYQMKYFIGGVGVVTAILYMVSNLLLIFYYEYLAVCYLVENIGMIFVAALSLLGVSYSVYIVWSKYIFKLFKRSQQMHRFQSL